MAKTDEQKAADKQMEEAVEAQMRAYGILSGNTMMVDYITVVEGMGYDDDGDVDRESYGIVMRHGSARSSVAIGLLAKANDLLLRGERVEMEEE